MTVIVGTGHRPSSLHGGYRNTKLHTRIKAKINTKLQVHDRLSLVISGMALGLDQWLAEECIELGIPFLAALPFEGQENAWPPKSQEHYQWILSKASRIVYVDREPGYISKQVAPGVYHAFKMHRRNHWMVDQLRPSDILLSLWNGKTSGGTWNCIKYAGNTCDGMRHINIDPISLLTTTTQLNYEDFDDVPF